MYNYNILSTSDPAVCTTTTYCPHRTHLYVQLQHTVHVGPLYVQLQHTVHVGPSCMYNYNILSTSDPAVCTTTTYCPRRTVLYVQLQHTVHVGPLYVQLQQVLSTSNRDVKRRRHDTLRKVLLCPQPSRLDEAPCRQSADTPLTPFLSLSSQAGPH